MPYLGDSYPADWPETDDRISSLPIDNFVSGHGPIGNHGDLMEAREFIHVLVAETTQAIHDEKNEQDASSEVIAKMNDRFGDWIGFDTMDEKFPDVYRKLS